MPTKTNECNHEYETGKIFGGEEKSCKHCGLLESTIENKPKIVYGIRFPELENNQQCYTTNGKLSEEKKKEIADSFENETEIIRRFEEKFRGCGKQDINWETGKITQEINLKDSLMVIAERIELEQFLLDWQGEMVEKVMELFKDCEIREDSVQLSDVIKIIKGESD